MALRPVPPEAVFADAGSTPFGSLLDVAGTGVGHHQRTGRGWQTGTTVVVCPDGATPGIDVRGGGPGTRETDALRPENLIDTIHAVCLTGGSAYGLCAADGVVAELADRGLGFPVGPEPSHVVPVVPAAVVFDLGRGGRFDHRPDPEFGRRATRRAFAARDRPAWGSVGAGTGCRSGGLQGGVGTASTVVVLDELPGTDSDDADRVEHAMTVSIGAVAVVNSLGSPIDPTSGRPWDASRVALRRPTGAEVAALAAARRGPASGATTDHDEPSLNTTIGVVAVSAELDKAAASRVATVAHDGLARAIRPAHAMADGDTVVALATGRDRLPTDAIARRAATDLILAAAADVFADACLHAVLAATTLGDAPAWRDLVPH